MQIVQPADSRVLILTGMVYHSPRGIEVTAVQSLYPQGLTTTVCHTFKNKAHVQLSFP